MSKSIVDINCYLRVIGQGDLKSLYISIFPNFKIIHSNCLYFVLFLLPLLVGLLFFLIIQWHTFSIYLTPRDGDQAPIKVLRLVGA